MAVSADTLATTREEALAAGCDRYLTKPVRRAALLAEVASVWGDGGA